MTILALLIPVLIGFVICRLAWPNGWGVCRHDVFRASLGAGIGLGIGSCIFFLALAAGAPQAALPVEAVLLAVLAVAYGGLRRRAACVFCASEKLPVQPAHWLLAGAAALAAAASLVSFVLFSVVAPLGEWDAWSIWNLRAKFLGLAAKTWTDGFSPIIAWSHPDYPLLIPASIAQAWHAAGAAQPLAPILVAGVF
ncbi:MAG: hypothetical protein ABI165_18065, partial [Bryobacteraceae bacterium]